MNMSYETFKGQVNKDIREYVKEKYPDASVICRKRCVLNEEIDSIEVCINDNASSLNVRGIYDEYCTRGEEDYQDLVGNIYNMVDSALKVQENLIKQFICTKEEIKKDQIIFLLINTEKNKEFLKTIPHRDFLDLSVVYKYLPCEGVQAFINNAMCEDMNLSEEELYELAKENTKRICNIRCADYYEFLKNELSKIDIPAEVFEMCFGKSEKCNFGYLMLAKENFYGPVGLLYEDILEELSKKLNSNFFIIPSSIYECIIHDGASHDAQLLKEILLSVNEEEISKNEFLSTSVYRYSADNKKIEIAE